MDMPVRIRRSANRMNVDRYSKKHSPTMNDRLGSAMFMLPARIQMVDVTGEDMKGLLRRAESNRVVTT